jgi:hypothetical protein
MTTTYDTEFGTETIAAPLYDDPDTYTIVEAWASSQLDEFDNSPAAVGNAEQRGPAANRAKLFAALAAGIIGGATLGAVLFGYRPVAPPTVMVPGFGVTTSDMPGQTIVPTDTASRPELLKPAALPAQVAKQGAPAPGTTPTVDALPNADINPGLPPVSGPPVVDVWIPPLPTFIDNKPEPPVPPAPPVPDPDPPVLQPPNIDVVQVAPDPKAQSPDGNGSRFEIALPNAAEPATGGLKPIDRGNGSRFTTKLSPNKPNPRQLNTVNRATIAKP